MGADQLLGVLDCPRGEGEVRGRNDVAGRRDLLRRRPEPGWVRITNVRAGDVEEGGVDD